MAYLCDVIRTIVFSGTTYVKLIATGTLSSNVFSAGVIYVVVQK